MGREVSESCLEGVIREMVASYCSRIHPTKLDFAARRIEAIGYQVGHQLAERYTVDGPRFTDHLEAIKFICKEFWVELFKKHIDNLRTNHKGTFVLQDSQFRWLTSVSADTLSENKESLQEESPKSAADSKSLQAISMHLYFPCGLIRGALSNLGVPCSVSADMSNLPSCSFVVRIKP